MCCWDHSKWCKRSMSNIQSSIHSDIFVSLHIIVQTSNLIFILISLCLCTLLFKHPIWYAFWYLCVFAYYCSNIQSDIHSDIFVSLHTIVQTSNLIFILISLCLCTLLFKHPIWYSFWYLCVFAHYCSNIQSNIHSDIFVSLHTIVQTSNLIFILISLCLCTLLFKHPI